MHVHTHTTFVCMCVHIVRVFLFFLRLVVYTLRRSHERVGHCLLSALGSVRLPIAGVCRVSVRGREACNCLNCVGANCATVLPSRSCACRSIENGRHYECAPKLKHRLAHCSLTRLCRVKRHLSGMRTSDESRGCRARSRWNSSHLRLALSVLRAAFTWTTLKRNGTHSRTRRRTRRQWSNAK